MGYARAMIEITPTLFIDEREIDEDFVRSSGPGGQNVNKLSTAVQLRFNIRRSPSLPNDIAIRAQKLAGKKLTQEGVVVIVAQRFRTQERNREDARERLVALLREAATPPPPPRRATKPSKASKARRLESKSRRSNVKSLRGGKFSID
ncbi:alternative ribosome rescue aminoacyl-tRNA hydrolase ArfB [Labrys sp. KNU-23]|uniref:alternative ribosome rescue aminoacyl-tRNA hydrolase ArfB n=1 Tax=Labrys sp. KNU-23 TaxID=2789216 RepID=UPI001FEE3D8C|nr:alternative ribosome rescue aminoacyl-tRNA hydrolase ArfB [Labrys sp. KNU-23]